MESVWTSSWWLCGRGGCAACARRKHKNTRSSTRKRPLSEQTHTIAPCICKMRTTTPEKIRCVDLLSGASIGGSKEAWAVSVRASIHMKNICGGCKAALGVWFSLHSIQCQGSGVQIGFRVCLKTAHLTCSQYFYHNKSTCSRLLHGNHNGNLANVGVLESVGPNKLGPEALKPKTLSSKTQVSSLHLKP